MFEKHRFLHSIPPTSLEEGELRNSNSPFFKGNLEGSQAESAARKSFQTSSKAFSRVRKIQSEKVRFKLVLQHPTFNDFFRLGKPEKPLKLLLIAKAIQFLQLTEKFKWLR
jgi:hypothetical protein